MSGKPYSIQELKCIVDYLVENKLYGETKARKMWQDFANTKLTTRTWQSLKETFLKRILPDIHNPYFHLTNEQISSFRSRCDLADKNKNKLEFTTISDDSNSNGPKVNEPSHNEGETTTGEKITSSKVRSRSSADTIILENCYKSAEDIRKDLEANESDERPTAPSKSFRDCITYSEPLTPMLQEVLDDFASEPEDSDREGQMEIVENVPEANQEGPEPNNENRTTKSVAADVAKNAKGLSCEVVEEVLAQELDGGSKPGNKSPMKNIPNVMCVIEDLPVGNLDDEISSMQVEDGTEQLEDADMETAEATKIVTAEVTEKTVAQNSETPDVVFHDSHSEPQEQSGGLNKSNSTVDASLPNNPEALKNKNSHSEPQVQSRGLNKSNSTVDASLPNNPEALKNKNSETANNKKAAESVIEVTNNTDKTPSMKIAARKRSCSEDKSNTIDNKKKKLNTKMQSPAKRNNKVTEPHLDTNADKLDNKLKANKESIQPDVIKKTSLADKPINLDKPSASFENRVEDIIETEKRSDTKEIKNPCLQNISLFNKTNYIMSESSDAEQNKKESQVDEQQASVSKPSNDVVVLKSNSESDDTVVLTSPKKKQRAGVLSNKTEREKAIANMFGFTSGGGVGAKRKRQLSRRRRTVSHSNVSHNYAPHHAAVPASNTSDWTSDSEDYVSPPRSRKNRQTKKFQKPHALKISALEEEGGLFVMYGKKIYPIIKDGKIIKNYVTYLPESDSEEGETFWKQKYEEEKKKASELKKLLEEVKEPQQLQDRYSPILQANTHRYHKNKKHSKNHPTFKFVSDDLMDLNASFDLIMENQKERSNDPEEDNITEEQTLHNNYIITENIETDNVTKVTTEENVTMNPDTVPEHNENFVTLKLDHLNSIISENRALTTENQILKESIQRFQNLEQDTKRGFAGIQIQLDKIFDFIKSKSFSNNDDMEANTQPIDDLIAQKNIEFPINSVKQLDSLENELTNANFEKALVKKFSTISGTSGHHKISKIGLQISKSFFNDELLNHFTWRGIKGCSKPPFMPYINIRNCFYKIIRLADNSCTALEADSFLQNSAIKHSGQRIKRKSNSNVPMAKKSNMAGELSNGFATEIRLPAPDEKKENPEKNENIKIKFSRNNQEIQLEGNWRQIHPALEQVVQIFHKEVNLAVEPEPSRGSEQFKEMNDRGTTPIIIPDLEVHEKVNQIETEIFKEIEELDKEVEVEPNEPTTNITKRKGGRPRKSSSSVHSPEQQLKPSNRPETKESEGNSRTRRQKAKETENNNNIQENVSKQPTRVPRKILNETVNVNQSKPMQTRRSTQKINSSVNDEEKNVKYMLPPRNNRHSYKSPDSKKTNQKKSSEKSSKIFSSPDTVFNSLDSTQGYQDSDASPINIGTRKKKKIDTSSLVIKTRNSLRRSTRKKTHPYLYHDECNDSSHSSVDASVRIVSRENSSLNTDVYRSESYQLLNPRAQVSSQLDPIDEKTSINNETYFVRHLESICRNEISAQINHNFTSPSCQMTSDFGSSSNVSLPMSPELSVVENLSISKEMLKSVEDYPTINEMQSNEIKERTTTACNKYNIISDVDISVPLVNQECQFENCNTVTEMSIDPKSLVTETLLNNISTFNINEQVTGTDTLNKKLHDLLLESAKKAAELQTVQKEASMMDVDITGIEVQKKPKANKKRCSTPQKRKGSKKSVVPTVDPVVEEECVESCSHSGRKSCPPLFQTNPCNDNVVTEEINMANLTIANEKPKGRKKKDIIRVKIQRPKNKKATQKIRAKSTQNASKISVFTDSGINDSGSEVCFVANNSVDLIHNHSETCLHANECVGDSIEFVENSLKSVITLGESMDSGDNVWKSRCGNNEEHSTSPDLFCNNAQDVSFYNRANADIHNTSDTVYHSPLDTDESPNSLITEDLSDASPPPARPSKWYLFSEDETNTNLVGAGSSVLSCGNYSSNLKQLFPITCAVPDLSTITEMSKENESSRKPTLEDLDGLTGDDFNSLSVFHSNL